MNEQANGQLKQPAQSQANGGADRSGGYGDAPRFTVDKASGKTAGKKNEAVLGPFTIRDLTVFGSTLILFVASLIPMFAVRYNLWNLGSLFFLGLGILLPVIVAALFVARRLSPGTKIRIGSLSVDQFGSVVASFAVAFFFLSVAGAFVPSMLLALVGALGLFAATVLGRLIPFFAGDFLDRAEVPAHVVARESAVPVRKPRAPKAPKEAKDEKAPKAAGTSAVAGWAKRMTPGGSPLPRSGRPRPRVVRRRRSRSRGLGRSCRVQVPPQAPQLRRRPPPSKLQPSKLLPSPPRPAPVVSSPETQAAGVVPAASAPGSRPPPSRPRPPPSCPRRHSAARNPIRCGRQVPDAQARAAAAAEETPGRRGSRGRPATAPPPR